jgi:NAD+ kinase
VSTRTATVLTHRRVSDTAGALRELIDRARTAGVLLRFDRGETEKHGLAPEEGVILCDADLSFEVDLCIVLGGDGTILTALRHYAGTEVPVFAVNFGAVGFLATIDPDGLGDAFGRAFRGEFDTLPLPSITVGRPEGEWTAMNDISVHRKHGLRVADLAYALGGEEIGRVRCDGLVVSTPQGSTGYNLANGGPVLAWGVEGFVVSFIAPHTLTARALVVAPGDVLSVTNRSRQEDVEMTTDGNMVCVLPHEDTITIRFQPRCALLAQAPVASFYHRLREKFGRLAY